LYPVSVDGKWGYIDKTGALVIKPQFHDAMDFSEGMAAISITDSHGRLWGYIDTSGAIVIQPQPQFVTVRAFSEGLAAVQIDPGPGAISLLWGFFDKTGRLVIPAQYERIGAFSEGLCAVSIEKDGKQECGYIDKAGTMVIKPRFDEGANFSEDLAAELVGNRTVFIDQKGNEVLHLPVGMRINVYSPDFSEGLAAVQDSVDPRHLIGYIDKTGAVVIKPQFDWAGEFSEGLAAIAIKKNGVEKYGYIDKTGAWVIQPQFDTNYPFREGVAMVGTLIPGGSGDILWSFIDKTGKVVIKLQRRRGQVPHGQGFSGGLARLDTYTDAGHQVPDSTTYIDTSGKVIWQGK
jgi:hypothetical protein